MDDLRTPRVDVKVGDILLTPRGEVRVLSIDLAADALLTTDGAWGFEEIEEIAPPDVKDPESVERWLGIAAQVIPRLAMEHRTVTCSCDCSACYRVDMWETTSMAGQIRNFRTSHFRNNSTCDCDKKACSCRA